MKAIRSALAAGLVLALGVAPAAAQFPLPLPGAPQPPDPQQLQPTRRAPFTITPSLTITGEYNDNIFLDNRNRVSDFILGITPGLALSLESPTYRLAAAYSFTSEIFAQETEETHAFDRQFFILDTLWRVTEHVTLSLTDTFLFDTDTNLISQERVSTGRNRSWSNSLAGGVGWEINRLHTLRGRGGWTAQRFDSGELENSDVYSADIALDRALTRQLTGTIEYQFAYFDIEFEQKSTVHTPRLGVSWRPIDTLTLSLNGGPSFELKEDGETRITPAITASYRQRFSFGAVGLAYDKAVGTAGGVGGTTDNQLISGSLELTTLLRGLTVKLQPYYSIVESPHSDRIDIRSLTVGLQAIYRLTDVVALVAGYQFFRQRTDSTGVTRIGTPVADNADQNRVYLGVQFGYPIRFD